MIVAKFAVADDSQMICGSIRTNLSLLLRHKCPVCTVKLNFKHNSEG